MARIKSNIEHGKTLPLCSDLYREDLTVDYSKYTYRELLDCLNNIDRDKYPERTKEIELLLSKKNKPNETEEYSKRDSAIVTVLGVEFLIWVILGFAALLGYSIF